jgi:hypothetical protein
VEALIVEVEEFLGDRPDFDIAEVICADSIA